MTVDLIAFADASDGNGSKKKLRSSIVSQIFESSGFSTQSTPGGVTRGHILLPLVSPILTIVIDPLNESHSHSAPNLFSSPEDELEVRRSEEPGDGGIIPEQPHEEPVVNVPTSDHTDDGTPQSEGSAGERSMPWYTSDPC